MQKPSAELVTGVFGYTKNAQAGPATTLPDWDDFRVLLTVIQMGSFNRAAQALDMTQPTVSRRIERLEEALKTRIVDRTTSGAVLTLEGQRIVEELRVAQAALSRAVDQSQARQSRIDDVKIVMTDGLATYWMTLFMPILNRRFPDLRLKLFVANDAVLNRGGHFDLSIHFLAPTDPDLLSTRLGTLHFIPYASPDYLKEYGKPKTVADLKGHRLLDQIIYLVDKGSWVTRLPGVEPDRTKLFTNSSAILCEAVRRGGGIALLPNYASLFERDLVALDIGMHLETPFWVCYREDSAERPAVQLALKFLKHILNRRMPWFAEQYVPPSKFPTTTPNEIMRTFLLQQGPVALTA